MSAPVPDSRQEKMRELIATIKDLPPVPGVLTQLLNLLSDENTNAKLLEETILQDPTLTAKVLAMANSSYYGYARQLSSVAQAVVVLGYKQVKSLAIGVFTANSLSSDKGPMDTGGFWLHSLAVSHLAQKISLETKRLDDEAAQVAGLLHDLGKLVFNGFLSEQYSQCLRKANDEGMTIVQAENEIIGVDHNLVGQWFAERWNLPEEIVEAIAFHHAPHMADEDVRELVYAVHLSDALVRSAKIGNNGDQMVPKITADTLEVLGLSVEQLRTIHQNLNDEKESIEALACSLA
jgi:putative nucleotidyltransferase with HDIG domain